MNHTEDFYYPKGRIIDDNESDPLLSIQNLEGKKGKAYCCSCIFYLLGWISGGLFWFFGCFFVFSKNKKAKRVGCLSGCSFCLWMTFIIVILLLGCIIAGGVFGGIKLWEYIEMHQKVAHPKGYSYAGCYENTFGFQLQTSPNITEFDVESCYELVKPSAQTFALGNGTDCYSGYIPPYGDTTSGCNIPCVANEKEICGGKGDILSFYNIKF